MRERGIRKRGGVYYANIQVEGRRREFPAGPDLGKAIALRSKLKLMARDGSLLAMLKEQEQGPPPKVTYNEAVELHFEQHLKHLAYGKDAKARLSASVAFFDSRAIDAIRWQEVETFRNQRLNEIAPPTVKIELDLMHAVFKRQVRDDVITKNPLDFVQRPKFDNTREEVLTHREFLRLLNIEWKAEKHSRRKNVYEITRRLDKHVKVALVIADYTAMRISEILRMKWSHIRGDYETIYVPKSKNMAKRHVPIHAELARILRSIPRESVYVVSHRRRKVDSIRKGFIAARKEAGLTWAWIHDFRHRAITRWVQEGHAINAIMKATGHKTYSAFQRYANLKDGDILTLVGKKTKPLPYITLEQFLGVSLRENVAKVWQGA